jgi:hypothetical protein
MNALKSGIHAESVIITGEDPVALAQLTETYYHDHQPETAMERAMLDNVVRDRPAEPSSTAPPTSSAFNDASTRLAAPKSRHSRNSSASRPTAAPSQPSNPNRPPRNPTCST